MTFFNAFLNFIAWIFNEFDSFRLCIAVICCFAGWFAMSEIIHYMAFPFDDRFHNHNDDSFKGI